MTDLARSAACSSSRIPRRRERKVPSARAIFVHRRTSRRVRINLRQRDSRNARPKQGRSPFWDALGRHFFGIDFAEADRLSVINKKFIAELMPKHPIYIPLLPEEAQDVIGKPHRESVRTVKNLEEEGFTFSEWWTSSTPGPS